MKVINGLFNFDIPLIECNNFKLNKEKIFYVYVLLNPFKEGIWWYGDYVFVYEPFYIGKGKNKRLHSHIKEAKNLNNNSYKCRKIRKIINRGQNPIVGKICINLNEEEALFLEEDIISKLWHYKCLTNVTKDCGGGDNYKFNPNKEKIGIKISESSKKYYREHPERVIKHSIDVTGIKNGRYNKGYLTEGRLNGKYKEIDENKLIELYILGFNCGQIGLFLNVSSNIPKSRLRKINIIKSVGKRTTKIDYLNKEKILVNFLKGELNYEQCVKQRKEFINSR